MIKKTFKKKFKKMQIFITIIFLCMFIIGPPLNHDFTNNNGLETTNNSLNTIPNIQDFITNSSGQTSNINVTLHQAYHNSTTINIDKISNSFTVPAPNTTDFSTSFVDISVDNLTVSNRSYTIQDTSNGNDDVVSTRVVSFVADRNCYLANASFSVRKAAGYTSNGSMAVLWRRQLLQAGYPLFCRQTPPIPGVNRAPGYRDRPHR